VTFDAPVIEWQSDKDLLVNGTHFFISKSADEYVNRESTADSLVVVKSREMIEDFVERHTSSDVKRIVEIGIFKGGSTALIASLLRPARFTALELSSEPLPGLAAFIEEHELEDVVRLRFGFDQSDTAALQAVLDDDHGDEPLDLVIDDASHLYRETRASFEVLFPRLRPGGTYLIEDWSWAHYPEQLWQNRGGWFHDRPALTNLVVEILMMLGSYTDLVARMRVLPDTVEIVRGRTEHPGPLRLEAAYFNRGLRFRPLL
jgi:predicted O-methyltransferase YrrM